jgi:hypothetical protein
MGRASNAADWMMRTFLDALERSIVDCREHGTNWAGRSPLLGSIVRCCPKSKVQSRPWLRGRTKVNYCINPLAKPRSPHHAETVRHDQVEHAYIKTTN